MSLATQGVQFILNDTDLVLDSSEINPEGLSDIIYSDGTRAFLVNGHIIQGETQAVVLQEDDLNQYYIRDENGDILIADNQDTSTSQSLDGTEIVQYVDEDGDTTEEPQVVYINEDGFTIQDSDLFQYQITGTQEGDSTFPLKALKLETQVVDLEELMRQQGDGGTAVNLNEENGYQYAILKDGKLHIQSYSGDILPLTSPEIVQPQECEMTEEQILLDLSKITGRNLLTGQTVTLHSYMDKLQKKIKSTTSSVLTQEHVDNSNSIRKKKVKNVNGLNGLLNKKLTLGKTTNGKRLVGKIIHVEKKNTSHEVQSQGLQKTDSSVEAAAHTENVEQAHNKEQSTEVSQESHRSEVEKSFSDSPNNFTEKHTESTSDKKILICEKIVSKECFEQISRTLSGLMNMESVKKKLQYKNIIIKVVEKKYIPATKMYTKNVSYSSGYMEEEFTINDTGEVSESWSFVPDQDTKNTIFEQMDSNEVNSEKETPRKYMETTVINLIITQEENNERIIRVILNPTNGHKCSICAREFRSNLQLRVHLNNAHKSDGSQKMCEVCGNIFENFNLLQEHRKVHVNEGKLFHCLANGCGKFFLTAGRLKRHCAVHNIALRPLECSVCLHRCSSESGLKKHLMTHMNIKPFYCEICGKSFTNPGDLNFHKRIHDPYKYYACEICKRTFSRQSNLQRHVEIHKGSGELYQCTICGCSYHYMSSLTRHVVQNHLKRQSTATPAENELEET